MRAFRRSVRLEFLGVAVRDRGFGARGAAVDIPGKSRKLSGEIHMLDGEELPFWQMRKLEGKLHFAQTSVMGEERRAALRTLHDVMMRGGR